MNSVQSSILLFLMDGLMSLFLSLLSLFSVVLIFLSFFPSNILQKRGYRLAGCRVEGVTFCLK